MTRRILAGAGPGAEPSDPAVVAARDAGFLWLDVEAPDPADLSMLREVFGVDPGLLEPGPAGPRLHEEEGFIAVTLAGAASGDRRW